ncbi:MAG: FN3 associated domain-containing protein [Clostridium sp.]|nr:FN3 associated domain-containing protein [Clostridium sp.]
MEEYISNNKEPVSSINLKGSITDNLSGYSFYINGDYVLDVNIKDEYEGQYGDLFTRNFEKNIEINLGLNYIKYDAYDFINGGPANYNGKVFEIYNGSIIPDKPVITEVNISNKEKEITLTNTNYDLDHLEWSIDVVFDKLKDVKSPKISVEKSEDETSAVVTISSDYDDINRIEYSFDNQDFIVYDGPIEINKTSTIYAVAYDELGNSSEVVLEKIELKEKKNEKDEPKEEKPDKKDDDGNMTQTSDESIKQIIMFLILMEGSILVMLKLRKKVE